MDVRDFDRNFGSLFVGGKEFPNVPFQIAILDANYCRRYSLPYMTALTVTSIRYSIKHKEVRYSLLDAVFDFPWDEKSCEPLNLYFPN